jgi:acid phosphatase family membrane protein YuiD
MSAPPRTDVTAATATTPVRREADTAPAAAQAPDCAQTTLLNRLAQQLAAALAAADAGQLKTLVGHLIAEVRVHSRQQIVLYLRTTG